MSDRRSARELAVRLCNVAVASVALVLLSPVMLVVAVAIRLESRGPIIYRQLRVGLDRRSMLSRSRTGRRSSDLGGRPFMLYKFRTMYTDAEAGTGPVWCGKEDDRVTRVGRLLRRHRLDEIPQFWNVLRGDMSVVGPRPERPAFVSYLREEIEEYPLRQRVRPGITGWAQVNQDADQTLEDVRRKLRYDLDYVRRRSVWFDLRIMARTVPVMARRERLEGDGDGEQARETTGELRGARRVSA
ncbi:MAG TPA: sugar transferase [Gemmatimonadota bacterium]|nr:sugar transferase [Gemmatimonadota bacterium]